MNQDLPIDLDKLNALEPHPDDAVAAGAFLMELRTRVTTRPLHPRSGDEETAIESVHLVVTRVREILLEFPNARRFELLALGIVDYILRPRTDRWSHWVLHGSIAAEEQRRTFRRELERELQPALRHACALLEKLRDSSQMGGFVPDDLFMGIPMVAGGPAPLQSRRALEPIAARAEGSFANFDEVLEAEKRVILGKRGLPPEGPLVNAAGLAFSGGGIRSATFALGVLQVLAKRGLFRQFHYLSTVSGGGYLGTFLSSYLNDPGRRIEEIFDRETPVDTAPVRHLRNNSKYLLDGGARNQFRALCLLVFGILTNLVTILPIVALLAAATVLAAGWGFWGGETWPASPQGSVRFDPGSFAVQLFKWAAFSALAIQLLLRPLFALATRGTRSQEVMKKWRRGMEFVGNGATLLALLLGAIALVPLLFRWFNDLTAGRFALSWPDWAATGLAGLLPFVTGPLAAKFAGKKLVGPLLRVLFLASGPLFFLCLYVLLGNLAFSVTNWDAGWIAAAAVLTALIWISMDLNALSPHHMYRRLLTRCYLARGVERPPGAGGSAIDIHRRESLPLTDLSQGDPEVVPYHLLNATINLPGSKDPELRGRKGDFFLFSKEYCGSPSTNYVPTAELLRTDPSFDLGSAMAVSGAAFSSNMGVKDLGRFRFLLTLLNIRLGYWLPNPSRWFRRREQSARKAAGARHLRVQAEAAAAQAKRAQDRAAALREQARTVTAGTAASLRKGARRLEADQRSLEKEAARLSEKAAMDAQEADVLAKGAREEGSQRAAHGTDSAAFLSSGALFWKALNTPGPVYLFREMFGWMHERLAYANISDGGHIENLGVYELLRRRCKYIVSVDGECDPNRYFDGLIKLIRYARIDLGAHIEIVPAELEKDERGFSPRNCLLGKVIYADGSVGWIVYLKLSLTGSESPDVLDYQREDPAFPHQTTLDQIYSEKQFESYRALGEHVARGLFLPLILANVSEKDPLFGARSKDGSTDLPTWFEALAMQLLPDNDPVFRADPTNLVGLVVGISISNSDTTSPAEINQATLEVSRTLIGLGAKIVLGHDWREDGVMVPIARFAYEDRVINARALAGDHVILSRVPAGRAIDPPPDMRRAGMRGLVDIKSVSGGLHALREELTALCDARVCLGGQTCQKTGEADGKEGFSGPVPGVVEEAWRAANDGQVVLISPCLGGAAAWMAQRLADGRARPKSPDYNLSAAESKKLGLPATPNDLVRDLGKAIRTHSEATSEKLYPLHQRLWQTTTLEAAIAVMVEILVLTKNAQANPAVPEPPAEGN